MATKKAKYDKAAFLDSIVSEKFDTNQYYGSESDICEKRQLFFHFTVSGFGTKGDIEWWRQDKRKVAACIIVDYEGVPHQLYGMRFWAHHLGISEQVFVKYLDESELIKDKQGRILNNLHLNRHSIAIELDTWGALMETDGNYYPVRWNRDLNRFMPDIRIKPVPKKQVLTLAHPYRDFKFFERFSDAQIETSRQICYYCNEKYGIPLTFNERMFDVTKGALLGTPGIWSHTSVRPDKSDIMPQPEFIQMLKSL
jgi:hypothetical protein